MEKQKEKQHGAEIKFSDINPLELWKKLGLAQSSDVNKSLNERGDLLVLPSYFMDEESKKAFEAFKADSENSSFENSPSEGEIIPENKGSLFIWALLREIGKRSRKKKKLSSVCYIFKDVMCATILRKSQKLGVPFEAEDFDEISSFLQGKRLVRTSEEGIRITRKFTENFHKKYRAWLVF